MICDRVQSFQNFKWTKKKKNRVIVYCPIYGLVTFDKKVVVAEKPNFPHSTEGLFVLNSHVVSSFLKLSTNYHIKM